MFTHCAMSELIFFKPRGPSQIHRSCEMPVAVFEVTKVRWLCVFDDFVAKERDSH